MSTPRSDDLPGSPAALEAAAEDARAQALSQAKEKVQAEVAALGEEQREELRLRLKSLDEIEGGFGTALVESFPDFLPKPEMLGKTRGQFSVRERDSLSAGFRLGAALCAAPGRITAWPRPAGANALL